MGERRELPMIACSLDAAGQADRLAEWRALASTALLVEWTNAGAELTLDDADETEARRLVALESQCCPFFSFDFSRPGANVVLRVGAPDGAREAIARLLA